MMKIGSLNFCQTISPSPWKAPFVFVQKIRKLVFHFSHFGHVTSSHILMALDFLTHILLLLQRNLILLYRNKQMKRDACVCVSLSPVYVCNFLRMYVWARVCKCVCLCVYLRLCMFVGYGCMCMTFAYQMLCIHKLNNLVET